MKWSLWIPVLISGAILTTAVHGQSYSPLLKDTPMSRFSEGDLERFEAAHREALEESADGEAVSWENPDTGSSGTVVPLRTARIGGKDCRLVRMINRAGGQQGDSRFWFCRQQDGSWKIASPQKTDVD